MAVGGHVDDVLDVWPNEVVQRVQIGGGDGPMREGYKVVALLLKPSLGLFGLVGRRRVLLPHPGSATGHLIAPGDHHTLQHIQVHFGIDFQVDFEDVRWHDVALTWNHTKDHNRSRKLCFRHPGYVLVIRGNPDLHFEGAGNGPVVITWIGREHVLYSGASPISLVEHCVTFRHDRRLLSLLGYVYNWPTSRWPAIKKENWFSLNGNRIMSSFSRATILWFHPGHSCTFIYVLTATHFRRCPWCSRYRRRKWTRRHEFKSWTRLIKFHIALIPLGKVWIQLFSLQLCVNSRTD